MNISRDSYFYRFLDAFGDAPNDEIDSCNMFWLMIKNLGLIIMMTFTLISFFIVSLYPIVGIVISLIFGWKIIWMLFVLGTIIISTVIFAYVKERKVEFKHPVIESFKAWKNKYCIKFEVI